MPRKTTPKPKPAEVEDIPLDEEAATEAVTAALEDLKAEEAAAAFIAAQGEGGEAETSGLHAVETEPVLGESDSEPDAEPSDAPRAEAGTDAEGAGSEPDGSAAEEEAPVIVDEVDTRTAAERRPTYGGGLTIVTD